MATCVLTVADPLNATDFGGDSQFTKKDRQKTWRLQTDAARLSEVGNNCRRQSVAPDETDIVDWFPLAHSFKLGNLVYCLAEVVIHRQAVGAPVPPARILCKRLPSARTARPADRFVAAETLTRFRGGCGVKGFFRSH